jgi:hypothetical protein
MSAIQDQAMLRRLKQSRKPTGKVSSPVAAPHGQSAGGNQFTMGEYEGYDPVADAYIIGGELVPNLLTIDAIPEGQKMIKFQGYGDY